MKTWTFKGKISSFGGPADTGVAASEDLALYERMDLDRAPPGMFLDHQPPNTTGTARRLNPEFAYCAMRWAYNALQVGQDAFVGRQNVGKRLPVVTPHEALRSLTVKVTNPKTGVFVLCKPADFGPNGVSTDGRIIDVAPCVLRKLDVETDAVVEVEFTI